MAGPWEDYQPKAVASAGPWSDYAPAAITTGKAVNNGLSDIPRQLGLTARYGLEGLAQAAQVVTEPMRYLTDALTPDRQQAKPKSMPLGVMATQAADWIGLPSPQGANERSIGDAARLVVGAGGMAGAAGAASSLPGVTGNVFAGLASKPTQQLSSAAGAGLLGGASKEAGGGTFEQAGASLIGGVLGGLVPGAAGGIVNAGKRLFAPTLTQPQLDVQLTEILGKAGTDYSKLAPQVQRQLRVELASSLQAGKEVDPQAAARLADFRTVGATPTRGMVSQNPVQITQEMNLAKMAANSADGSLHGMPMIQNHNNSTLIRNLNDAGATAGDPFRAGSSVIGQIASTDAAKSRAVTGLYDAARAMPGGNTPLDRTLVVNGIYDALAKQNKMAYLPEDISNTLNTISQGQITRGGQTFHVPFDANALDNLMTDIATAQRGTQDGNVKAALKLARDAIEKMPISPVKTQYGGNQLVTQGGAAHLQAADAQAGQFMDALGQARGAARSRFGWQESAKPIEAALGGAEPDKFIQKFVIGGTVADAQAIATNAPAAGVKEAILAHLKDKSLNGAADEVGKFSQSAYNKALGQIGDRKLELFFNPEELAHLKAVGRVASYTQVQPVGSAVNNSNSGALLLGRGLDLLNKTPAIGPLVGPALKNIQISMQQRGAQNILPGLLVNQPKTPLLNGFVLPGLAVGGGLLAP